MNTTKFFWNLVSHLYYPGLKLIAGVFMRIFRTTYFVVGCLMLVSCGGDENSIDTVLYTRSECIVKFSLGLEDLAEVNEALSHFLVRMAIDEDFPIAGFTFPPPRTYHYIQYTDNCENRIEMSISMLDRFYQEIDLAPDYIIYRLYWSTKSGHIFKQ